MSPPRMVIALAAFAAFFSVLSALACEPQPTPEPDEATQATESAVESAPKPASPADELSEPTSVESSAAEDPNGADRPRHTGPRLSIDIDACDIKPGERVTAEATVVTSEGAPLELVEPVKYQWGPPDGWALEGEGSKITLIPSSKARGPADIRLTVEDSDDFHLRGGAMVQLE